MEECQLCRQPIHVVQDLVLGFVRWFVSSIWLTNKIECAVHAMREDKMLKKKHETLMHSERPLTKERTQAMEPLDRTSFAG